MAGVMTSDSSIEIRMPPMTAIASGWSICDPAPSASASGSIPATAASAVMTIGRSRRRPAWTIASSAENPTDRNFSLASSSRMPFFATMPITMISPMNDDTLNVVRVTSSARNTPDVDRIADDRMATGGGERTELEKQNEEDQHDRQHQHRREIAERFLLLLIGAAVFDADGRRQLQIGDGLLHGGDAGPHIDAFEACRHLDQPLKVLAANLDLARQLVDRRQRAERGGRARRADEHRVAHRLERRRAPMQESEHAADMAGR